MTTPAGLNPEIRTRELVFEADVQAVTAGSARRRRRSCTSAPHWHSD
jgi:hypothetical protein